MVIGPTTEAGKRLLEDAEDAYGYTVDWTTRIAAIEAEARAAALADVRARVEGIGGIPSNDGEDMWVLVAAVRSAIEALKPCPWCGHPTMCHKGSEGECPA